MFVAIDYLEFPEFVTWFVARQKCRELHMELATIPDDDLQRMQLNLSSSVGYWVGLIDHKWTWMDGE